MSALGLVAGSWLSFPAQTIAVGPFELSIKPEHPIVRELVTLTIRPSEPIAANLDRVEVSLRQDGTTVLSSDALTGRETRIAFLPSAAGAYRLDVRGVASDGQLADATFSFTVEPKPATTEETARGVLVILVSGGVLLGLTLAFLIILRSKSFPPTKSPH